MKAIRADEGKDGFSFVFKHDEKDHTIYCAWKGYFESLDEVRIERISQIG